MPGRDLAVVGFREEPRTHFLQPTLTSFRMSLRDLGAQLGETLLATMLGLCRSLSAGCPQQDLAAGTHSGRKRRFHSDNLMPFASICLAACIRPGLEQPAPCSTADA